MHAQRKINILPPKLSFIHQQWLKYASTKILHKLFTRAREVERNGSGEHKRMGEQGENER